jgi:hypothetical protein
VQYILREDLDRGYLDHAVRTFTVCSNKADPTCHVNWRCVCIIVHILTMRSLCVGIMQLCCAQCL